jgi:hypothetical protein
MTVQKYLLLNTLEYELSFKNVSFPTTIQNFFCGYNESGTWQRRDTLNQKTKTVLSVAKGQTIKSTP